MSGYSKLGRPTGQRLAMLRGLVTDTIKYGRIKTTLVRAKETQRQVERMITLGKKGDLSARRRALSYIYEPEVVKTLFDEIAPRYEQRNGGYTRIINLANRVGDNAPADVLELVEGEE